MVNQDYLKRLGFSIDENAPENVNRWEKSDGKTHFTSSYFVSITLTDDGERTMYGVVNFHSSDGHGYIVEHRSFDGVALSEDDLGKFMDRNCNNLPNYIRTTAKH